MNTQNSTASGRVVVVGAGHAGAGLVAFLRQAGYAGEVVLLGEELHSPYHRPPLSKKFMGADMHQGLRAEEFYDEINVDLRLGTTVTGVDRLNNTVMTSDGVRLGYEHLVFATGSRPRALTLDGSGSADILTLRTLDDALRLKVALNSGDRLVIVGGGYIGLEVAAEAISHGLQITVLEREPRILARVASPEFSEFMASHHMARGVQIITSADVTRFDHSSNGVRVELADGRRIECDAVLAGVGAVPNDELARDCGVKCADGIVVNNECRTSEKGIYAIGDVTRRPVGKKSMRFESIPSAMEQAKIVAAVVAGKDVPDSEVPWFWSDQFDFKLKIAGHVSAGVTACVRDEPETGKYGIFHLDEKQRLVAVETANAPAYFMAGKKFIKNGSVLDPVQLTDPDVDLRACASSN